MFNIFRFILSIIRRDLQVCNKLTVTMSYIIQCRNYFSNFLAFIKYEIVIYCLALICVKYPYVLIIIIIMMLKANVTSVLYLCHEGRSPCAASGDDQGDGAHQDDDPAQHRRQAEDGGRTRRPRTLHEEHSFLR